MTNNGKNLGELISEIMETRGLSPERLSELTNINRRYVHALLSNDLKNLPAAPYVRGYLLKIAETLETDAGPLQNAYRELELKTSGKNDRLPDNRFAGPYSKKSTVIAIVIILTLILFAANRWKALMGIPAIEVNVPERIGERDYLETRESSFAVKGKVNKKDSVSINDEPIPVDFGGEFHKEIILNEGLNTLEIKAERFLGRETTIIRKIFYISPEESEIMNNLLEENSPRSGKKSEASEEINFENIINETE